MGPTKPRSSLEATFYVVVALCGLVVALPLAGFEAWPLELIVSFRFHILIGLILVALVALVRRHRWFAAVLAIFALINGGDVAATYMSSAQALANDAAGSEQQQVRVLFANVQSGNNDHAALMAEISRLDPHVIVVAEATQAWATTLAGLSTTYPHIISAPRQHAFGMVLLSRLPLADTGNTEIITLPAPSDWETEPPVAIMVQVETEAGPVTVIGLHPFPPLIAKSYPIRNQQMANFAGLITDQTTPVIAIGDLNTTPWSPTLRSFLDDTGLRGPNILATWPNRLGFAGLPIDHVLLSRDLSLAKIERGADIGSDHRPLFAVITVGSSQGSPGTP